MGRVDPTDPESMQAIALEGIFTPEDTPAQKASLARLETALALVEGWVCHVVDSAAGGPAAERRPARRGVPAAPGRRRPGRADLRRAGRAGAAPPPAARGGGAVGGADPSTGASPAGTPSGATRTCSPPTTDFADPVAFARSQLDLERPGRASTSAPPSGRRSPAAGRRPDEPGESDQGRGRGDDRTAGRSGQPPSSGAGAVPAVDGRVQGGKVGSGPHPPPARGDGDVRRTRRGAAERTGGVGVQVHLRQPGRRRQPGRHPEQPRPAAPSAGATATDRVVSGRSSLPSSSPGTSGASPATTAAWSYPSATAAANTAPTRGAGTS